MMVEMKVSGLALDETVNVPVLILKDKEEKKVLPIWIGAMEAVSISVALNHMDLPRPLTHDLFLDTITHLNGRILRAKVVSLCEGTYYAELDIEQNGELKTIDCRPSDAVALALRANAPIAVNSEVLAQSELAGMNNQAMPHGENETEDWSEALERMSPDSKYKM